jgi:hypothetical protein
MKINTSAVIELELIVEAYYTPERPAPHVQNHDHPGFSDSGDDEECEFEAYFISHENGKNVKVPIPEKMKDYIYDTIADQVMENCRNEREIQLAEEMEYRMAER